jgi:hypothetical protein
MAKDLDTHIERLVRTHGPTAVCAAIKRAVERHLRSAAPSPRDINRIEELVIWREWGEGSLTVATEEASALEEEAGYPFDQRHRPDQQGRGGYLGILFPWMRH